MPLTENTPKCLVKVNGVPILVNTLDSLNKNGIQECVLVVGHLAESVMGYIGDTFENIKITYVKNEIFDKTCNIYSLWLVKLDLMDDVLLLGGDVFFEEEVLKKLCEDDNPDVIVVDDYRGFMNGTVVTADDGKATEMVLKKDQDDRFQYDSALKTVNMYKFSMRFMRNYFIPVLDSYIGNDCFNEFYEIVISEIIRSMQTQISVLSVNGLKWFVIDTYEDLKEAEKLFADVS